MDLKDLEKEIENINKIVELIKELESEESIMLYVIRHGQVDINVKGQLNGRNESILTDIGIEQAKNAIDEIKNLDIDLIICSPLIRTKQTCNIINIDNKPVIYDERILERDTNSMMYKIKNDVDLNLFYDCNKQIIFEDCEGYGSVIKRVKDFLKDIKNKYTNKNIIVVTHGDVCEAIYCVLNNDYNVESFLKHYPKNCEITEYRL